MKIREKTHPSTQTKTVGVFNGTAKAKERATTERICPFVASIKYFLGERTLKRGFALDSEKLKDCISNTGTLVAPGGRLTSMRQDQCSNWAGRVRETHFVQRLKGRFNREQEARQRSSLGGGVPSPDKREKEGRRPGRSLHGGRALGIRSQAFGRISGNKSTRKGEFQNHPIQPTSEIRGGGEQTFESGHLLDLR